MKKGFFNLAQCVKKTAFISHKKALNCAQRVGKEIEQPMRVYLCDICHKYHIARIKKEKGDNMKGELKENEPHPSAMSALEYVQLYDLKKLMKIQESYSSCAIEGNRLGDICGETLDRVMSGEPVSDRYILGLAWNIKRMEEEL